MSNKTRYVLSQDDLVRLDFLNRRNSEVLIQGLNGSGSQKTLGVNLGGTGNALFTDGEFVYYSAARKQLVSSGIGVADLIADGMEITDGDLEGSFYPNPVVKNDAINKEKLDVAGSPDNGRFLGISSNELAWLPLGIGQGGMTLIKRIVIPYVATSGATPPDSSVVYTGDGAFTWTAPDNNLAQQVRIRMWGGGAAGAPAFGAGGAGAYVEVVRTTEVDEAYTGQVGKGGAIVNSVLAQGGDTVFNLNAAITAGGGGRPIYDQATVGQGIRAYARGGEFSGVDITSDVAFPGGAGRPFFGGANSESYGIGGCSPMGGQGGIQDNTSPGVTCRTAGYPGGGGGYSSGLAGVAGQDGLVIIEYLAPYSLASNTSPVFLNADDVVTLSGALAADTDDEDLDPITFTEIDIADEVPAIPATALALILETTTQVVGGELRVVGQTEAGDAELVLGKVVSSEAATSGSNVNQSVLRIGSDRTIFYKLVHGTGPLAPSAGGFSIRVIGYYAGGADNSASVIFSGTVAVPAVGATAVITHALGYRPSSYRLVLECLTTELGYSVGDEVDAGAIGDSVSAQPIFTRVATTIQFQVIRKSDGVPRLPVKSTGVFTDVTPGNWRLKAYWAHTNGAVNYVVP